MNKERLQMVRDAVANSGKPYFDLSTYEHCVMGYCATLPEFQNLGLRPASTTISYSGNLHRHYWSNDYITGPGAVAGFLEIDPCEDYQALAAFTYDCNYEEYQKTRTSCIPTTSILEKIDAKLAELA